MQRTPRLPDVTRGLASLLLLVLSFTGRAAAHGPPPTATELLGLEQSDAALVRLGPGGIAHRVADGFRFICPEAWGGDVLAPTAAIASGPALVASDTLFVVEHDGRVTPHPVQSGVGIAVAGNADAVFGIFEHDMRHELRRLTGSSNDLLRVLDQPFGALAVGSGELSLLRWLDKTLTLQRVSFSGELLSSVTWTAPSSVAYARLHVSADRVYVSVWGRSAPWVTLGRMAEAAYVPLREANSEIAGPVMLSVGNVVAIDGMLQLLDSAAPVDTHGERITCFGELGGQPYACAHGDLLRVEAGGLGGPLFELGQLREPDDQTLSREERSDCTVRWTDLETDAANARLARAGDAGAIAPGDGGSPPASSADGCSTAHGHHELPWLSGLSVLTLCLARHRRRGGRRARASAASGRRARARR